MSRKPRVELDDAIYHVIKYGNDKENVFASDDDKEYLLYYLEVANFDNDFNLLGYAIMDNHYHLIIETKNRPLQDIIQQLNNSYSKNYNKRYRRTDNVFSGRYKALLVNDDCNLLALVRYVHHRPLSSSLCQEVSGYKWSSDYSYRNNICKQVYVDKVLNIFSKNRIRALELYKNFVGQTDINDQVDFYEGGDVVGNVELCGADDDYYEESTVTLDEILNKVVQDEQLLKLIKEGSRKRILGQYKKQYVLEAYKHGYSYREIGSNVNMTAEAANRLVRDVKKTDNQ